MVLIILLVVTLQVVKTLFDPGGSNPFTGAGGGAGRNNGVSGLGGSGGGSGSSPCGVGGGAVRVIQSLSRWNHMEIGGGSITPSGDAYWGGGGGGAGEAGKPGGTAPAGISRWKLCSGEME